MSSEVEDRIVAMKFDNQSFEKRLSETISSLDKLRSSIDNAGKTHGLENISSAAKGVDLSHITTSVEGVSTKFLALATVGITALTNIASKAITSGAAFVKSFTFGPMMDGFHEFETNMGSIQTILANTDRYGTTLPQVTKSLDELNAYSDKTIYNFGQMVSNIGLFTNAGIRVEDATSMIKGFSNAAAASGTNAQGAASAAYQLSQALSAGTIRLMDWRSLQNVGMGNKNMQQGLIELADAMGTVGKSGTSAKEIQSNFNGSLEKGWLSADVMSNYLKIMAGDMDEAQIAALGLDKTQVEWFKRQAKIGEESATKIRTFTQLVGTVKESIGSGWSETFRTVIGDFEEGTVLFTALNDMISGFVGHASTARNELLSKWKDLGGRGALISGFVDLGKAFLGIINPIKDAFRDIFPPMTAERLYEITQRFADFMHGLQIGRETAGKLRVAFRGIFDILDIGIEIVKGVLGVIGDLFHSFSGAGGGALDAAWKFGEFMDKIHYMLVDQGKIQQFFDKLSEYVRKPIEFINQLKDAVTHLFDQGIPGAGVVEDTSEGVRSRFQALADIADKVSDAWHRMGDRLEGVRDALARVWGAIAEWFGELGSKLAAVLTPDDFDPAVDAINVGLLGGIALMLKKFLNGGLKLDFGDGLMEKISGSFDQLTTTLKAMETKVKADALLKIAGAVGILAGSMLLLSTIDSASLTRALVAITIGFGQLIGTMTIMDKLVSSSGAGAKLGVVATGMILMASAMGILSIAIKNLSSLSWGELAKGLAGVAGGMAIMVGAMMLMSTNSAGLIGAGIAMTAMAGGMIVMAGAVKAFSMLDWGEMGKGLAGVAGSLLVIAGAMQLMPASLPLTAAGVLILSGALNVMALAVLAMGSIPFETMMRGLLGISISLAAIAAAMQVMPLTLPVTAAGVLILSGALNVMALAVLAMGSMDFGTIAKGIGGLAVMLGILVIAMNAMQGSIAGAVAITIISGALVVLAGVLKVLGGMSIAQLATGLIAIAGAFAILGAAAVILTPVLPMLFALSAAMGLLGVAFLAFGGGAFLVAKAFEAMSNAGVVGVKTLIKVISVLLNALPDIIKAFASSLSDMAKEILEIIPMLVKVVGAILDQLLDTLIKITPKLIKEIGMLLSGIMTLMREKVPEYVETGLVILMALLQGIRDNIGEIVIVVAEIITNFLDALAEKIPEIVDSVFNFLVTVITTVAEKLGEKVPFLFWDVSKAIIKGFLKGLEDHFGGVLDWFKELPGKIMDLVKDLLGIKSPSTKFAEIGMNILKGLLQGLTDTVGTITTFFSELPGKIVGWVGDITRTLWQKGKDLIGGILGGVVEKAVDFAAWYISLPSKVLGWLGDVARTLWQKGRDILSGFFNGVTEKAEDLKNWMSNLGTKVLEWIGNVGSWLKDVGKRVMDGLWDGLKDKWEDVKGWLSNLNPANWFNDINPYKHHAEKNLVPVGKSVMQGLHNGMMDGWGKTTKWLKQLNPADHLPTNFLDRLRDSLEDALDVIGSISDHGPVIKPVLDLSEIRNGNRLIDDIIYRDSGYHVTPIKPGKPGPINPETSRNHATHISRGHDVTRPIGDFKAPPGGYHFDFSQNIFSPQPLSTNDIYVNTKSLIARTKEELKIG